MALSIAAALGAAVPGGVLRDLRRECPGASVASAFLAAPARVFRPEPLPAVTTPMLMLLLCTGFRNRLRASTDLAACLWSGGRAENGLARSVWRTIYRLGEGVAWIVRLVAGLGLRSGARRAAEMPDGASSGPSGRNGRTPRQPQLTRTLSR
jgi:hypothetical protein